MKLSPIVFCALICAASVFAQSPKPAVVDAIEDPMEALMPSVRQGRAIKPATENPFRRFTVSARRTQSMDEGLNIEARVSQSIAGKGIGGIVPKSQHFRGGALLFGALVEIGDDIMTPNKEIDGEPMAMFPGYRVILRSASSNGLVVEVGQIGPDAKESKDTPNKRIINIAIEDYFRL